MAHGSQPVHSPETIPDTFLDVRGLSRYLNIKPSTLYAWVAQGRIPALKIHGLVRFQRAAIDQWVESFRALPASASLASRPVLAGKIGRDSSSLETIIARARQQAYNPRHGETRPKPSPNGKEGE
jgi:excisionase family DNA binding protein